MNAIIVDDTLAAIEDLAAKLKKYADINLIATADNGEDGITKVLEHRPELLFLDMELPDMTGIEFLERMRAEENSRCYVVIYTAYDDYMLPAFRNRAFDFLLKPVDDGELDTIINRFYADCTASNGHTRQEEKAKRDDGKLLFYTNSADFKLVQIRDICVFHYDHESRVWTVIAAGCDRPLRLKRNVTKDVLLRINDSFVQVSQKYIININYLLEVRDNFCRFYPPFDNIDYVKVARFFRRKLISRYNSL